MEIYEYMYDNYYSYDNFIVTTFLGKRMTKKAKNSRFELLF